MYAKLFSSLLSSSVWSEDSDTCKVWITLIALADREGFVFGSPSGLARICALPVEKVEAAIEKFLSSDQYSSDKVREPERSGRRIETVDGGWVLLNYAHYRDLSDADIRRAQYRASKRKIRGQSTNVNTIPQSSTDVPLSESSSSSDADTKPLKRERERFAPPSLGECREFFKTEGLSGDADAFYHHYESVGWRSGKAPLRKWKSAAHGWSKREASFSTARPRQGTNGPSPSSVASVNPVMPSGDYRLPTGGFAAADRSWFDYKGTRFFEQKPGVYRDAEGFAPDGSHKQNTAYTDAAREVADKILSPVPVKP